MPAPPIVYEISNKIIKSLIDLKSKLPIVF